MPKSSDGVAGLIEEYLQYFGFNQTLKTLRDEKKKTRSDGSLAGSLSPQFLSAFNRGDCKGFFELWEKHIPSRVRREDPTARKLTFYCHVHFAIFPLRNTASGSVQTTMKRFKSYLETSGLELSKTPEFLPFYALPFVDNAREHPTFKELLTAKWESEVRNRTNRFVQSVLQTEAAPRGAELPALLVIVEQNNLSSPTRVHSVLTDDSSGSHTVRDKLNRYEQEMLMAKRKCMETQMCAHGLLKVTYELLQTLERAATGKEAVDKSVLQMHFKEVSRQAEFLGNAPARLGAAAPPAVVAAPPAAAQQQQRALAAPVAAPVQLTKQLSIIPAAPAPVLASLQHQKLHGDLEQADDNTRCRLLQALRWRLSRSGRVGRRVVIDDYVRGDVLGLRNPEAASSCVQMMKLPDVLTREYVARLINVIAAEREGRHYLLSGVLCREMCVNTKALDDSDDGLLKQNLLGCLVKLSLHRSAQSDMIELGMLQWVVQQLRDIDHLSEYSQECSAALLMNLSLRTAGKAVCEDPSVQVIKVLSDLLEHESMGLRTYINGTLYSLLTRPKLREEAQALGLEDMLQTLDLSDEDFARQIRYIQQQLHSDALDNAESDANESEEDEEEDEEDALEVEEETLESAAGALAGEQLLCGAYLAKGQSAASISNPTPFKAHKAPKAAAKNPLARTLPRPATPGVSQTINTQHPFQKPPKTALHPSTSEPPNACRAPMPDEDTIKKVKEKMNDAAPGEQDLNEEFVTAFQQRSKMVRTPP